MTIKLGVKKFRLEQLQNISRENWGSRLDSSPTDRILNRMLHCASIRLFTG